MMFLSNIVAPVAKRILNPRLFGLQKRFLLNNHPIYSSLKLKGSSTNDTPPENSKANSASEIISSFPWLYGTQPDRSYYPYIKSRDLKPGLLPKLVNSFFSKPYYAKLLAVCFSEDKSYFFGDFKEGAQQSFKILAEALSSQDEPHLKCIMTPRLFHRYSEALSALASQDCKVQLSIKNIYEVKIRDIRVTFGPKEDSDSIPKDQIKGNVGFVDFILPKEHALGSRHLIMQAHSKGAIFKVDAAINADVHYQIMSPSGEILNILYNRTHVISFVNSHMEPNSSGLYSDWCWFMDDIDFLLDSDDHGFPEDGN